jgi:prepilin-type N-terminal cleavage/methylation domain-containing protein
MTLIEVLTVIVIIGIVATFALPRLDIDQYKMNSAVRGINSSVMYAQREAVSLQHDVRVAFDLPLNRLRIHEDANNDGIIQATERVTYANLEDGVTFAKGGEAALPFGGAVVNFTRLQGTLPVIIFRRDGTASENGGFYMNPRKSLAAGVTKNARAGQVVRSTGRIVWYTYATGTWVRGN